MMKRILQILTIIIFPIVAQAQAEATSETLPSGELLWEEKSELGGCPESMARVVFNIVVSKKGKVTKIEVVEKSSNVSVEQIKRMQKRIRRTDFIRSSSQAMVPSTGKVTFCIGDDEH